MQVRMNKQQQHTDHGWEMCLMQNLFPEVIMKPKMDKPMWFSGRIEFHKAKGHWLTGNEAAYDLCANAGLEAAACYK